MAWTRKQTGGALIATAVLAAGTTLAAVSTGTTAADDPVAHPDWILLGGHVSPDDPLSDAQCQSLFGLDCYAPDQIQHAYGIPALLNKGINGAGKTIVLIDAFGSPTIDSDFQQFENYLGGPDQVLRVIRPDGPVPAYDQNNGDMLSWANETTLDVEYSHAMAPGAKLVLLELPGDGGNFNQLIANAVEYVVRHHLGDVISQSFGLTEQATVASGGAIGSLHAAYADAAAHHITVLASTGDTGSSGYDSNGNLYTHQVVGYPATDPLVTAVGGTEISLDPNGNRLSPDKVWDDSWNGPANRLFYGSDGPDALASGGGKSTFFARPSYQNRVKNVTGARRGIPDVSMNGACSSLAGVFESVSGYGVQGWSAGCGTSEASPLMAGIVADADQLAGHDLGAINPALYQLAAQNAPGIVRVTSGQNGVQFTQGGKSHKVPGYYARNGYSLAAGVGTINAQYFVPELAKLG
jgi:subtilase family serine protease